MLGWANKQGVQELTVEPLAEEEDEEEEQNALVKVHFLGFQQFTRRRGLRIFIRGGEGR